MEIKVTVEAAPELMTAIDTLTAALVELIGRRVKTTAANAKPTPVETKKAMDKPEPADKPAQTNITLETVRAKLAALSQGGKQKEVKALITSFGVAKLTDIPEEKYPGVLEKAAALETES